MAVTAGGRPSRTSVARRIDRRSTSLLLRPDDRRAGRPRVGLASGAIRSIRTAGTVGACDLRRTREQIVVERLPGHRRLRTAAVGARRRDARRGSARSPCWHDGTVHVHDVRSASRPTGGSAVQRVGRSPTVNASAAPGRPANACLTRLASQSERVVELAQTLDARVLLLDALPEPRWRRREGAEAAPRAPAPAARSSRRGLFPSSRAAPGGRWCPPWASRRLQPVRNPPEAA